MSTVECLRDMVCGDIDPDFLEAAAIAVAWEYHRLYEELAENPSLTDDVREEEFGRRRAASAVSALVSACDRHGVPREFRRLGCNGQNKLFIKSGRVIIIQEPITTLSDRPKAADYKLGLADCHGLIRQLELDLGDRPRRITDWSGCALAVLLHGENGRRFGRGRKALGGLFLAVPDAGYAQWILRLDLHDLALFGRRPAAGHGDGLDGAAHVQRDEVIVTPKRQRRGRTA